MTTKFKVGDIITASKIDHILHGGKGIIIRTSSDHIQWRLVYISPIKIDLYRQALGKIFRSFYWRFDELKVINKEYNEEELLKEI